MKPFNLVIEDDPDVAVAESIRHNLERDGSFVARGLPDTPQTWRNPMQRYLFIGGDQDGLNIPVADEVESIQLPVGAAGGETYIRDTLALGAYASFTFYRLEELPPDEVIDLLAKHYKEWAVHQSGGRN